MHFFNVIRDTSCRIIEKPQIRFFHLKMTKFDEFEMIYRLSNFEYYFHHYYLFHYYFHFRFYVFSTCLKSENSIDVLKIRKKMKIQKIMKIKKLLKSY